MEDVWKALGGWMSYMMKKNMMVSYDFFLGNMNLE